MSSWYLGGDVVNPSGGIFKAHRDIEKIALNKDDIYKKLRISR
jgi:hypothetical protein